MALRMPTVDAFKLETVGFSRFYHQLNDLGYSHKEMISLTMDELKTLRQELINQEDEGKQ